MVDTKESITEEIDKDEGLRSKRNMLTVVSLILLALEFSGASVLEANTFILNIEFERHEGLAVLLVISVIFLLLRYYNYARPYHDKLYKLWTDRLFDENEYHSCEMFDDYPRGLIGELMPFKSQLEDIEHDERLWWSKEYKCGWFFRRFIVYYWNDEFQEYKESVSLFKNVKATQYLKLLWLELKHRIQRYFVYRENLDIAAPYILSVCAVSSYFFNEKLQFYISMI